MCGIAGIVGYEGTVCVEALRRAMHALEHRGPDDGGLQVVRVPAQPPYEVGLANRRLAILDLSPAGHQPMADSATGNWIVYNGEVYNFAQIKASLEKEGVRFSSHCDTEVVLKAYARWGTDCLQRFRGMFALAIWDAERQRLFLARDRLGKKPLYYGDFGRQFFFGSEVRCLLAGGWASRTLNYPGLLSFLTFGSVYDPETIIEGVHALRAGHYLIWESGRAEEIEYWDPISGEAAQWLEPGAVSSNSGVLPRKKMEELEALLEEAARLRLVSDVPVGVFLSGGIDSSAVVALLSREASARTSTFSIVFEEQEYNEAPFSRMVAERFKTDHHECLLSQKDAREAIPEAVRAMDQPTMDGVNTYVVSREARRAGLKVALSGLGGDELFAGYDTFATVPKMERFSRAWKRVPAGVRALTAGAYSRLVPASDRQRKVATLFKERGEQANPYILARSLFTPDQQRKLLSSHRDQPSLETEGPVTGSLRRAGGLDPINQVSYLELRNYMLNTLLRDCDVMSMAVGLEVRVPLIDHKLVEFVMALPGRIKMNGHVPKHLLVEAVGNLPPEVVQRRKRGFAFPFERWMREDFRGELESVFLGVDKGELSQHLDTRSVNSVWFDFLGGRVSCSRPWALYVLQRWCEMHL
jgi:asparagine synthase (glutamine-hydrolysing)